MSIVLPLLEPLVEPPPPLLLLLLLDLLLLPQAPITSAPVASMHPNAARLGKRMLLLFV